MSPLEIACDESGWEGTNLACANSDVIAYASVRLDIGAATEWVDTLRRRSGGGSHEYKAAHLFRTKTGPDLSGFLGPSGPLYGRATVHLTHKFCFILGRVFDLFVGDYEDAASLGLRPDPRLATLAARLCRTGPGIYGWDAWRAFLIAGNEVLRAERLRRVREPVDAFYRQVDALRKHTEASRAEGIFDELHDQRPRAYRARVRLLDDRALQPVSEPLIPALARTVLHWSQGRDPVAIVHDEQSALTERRMRRLEATLAAPPLEMIHLQVDTPFIRFRQTDSRTDARVQVADLLAGVARRIAAAELVGRADPVLTGLLAPYVDPGSRWCSPGGGCGLVGNSGAGHTMSAWCVSRRPRVSVRGTTSCGPSRPPGSMTEGR
jgi:hypothetical protein